MRRASNARRTFRLTDGKSIALGNPASRDRRAARSLWQNDRDTRARLGLFEPDTNIAGAILDNVAPARHASKLQSGIEQHGGIPVIGILPRDETLTIADRYIGLIPRREYAA